MYFVKKRGDTNEKFYSFYYFIFFQNLPLTAEVLNNLYHDTAWAASIKQYQITKIKQTVTNAEENFFIDLFDEKFVEVVNASEESSDDKQRVFEQSRD